MYTLYLIGCISKSLCSHTTQFLALIAVNHAKTTPNSRKIICHPSHAESTSHVCSLANEPQKTREPERNLHGYEENFSQSSPGWNLNPWSCELETLPELLCSDHFDQITGWNKSAKKPTKGGLCHFHVISYLHNRLLGNSKACEGMFFFSFFCPCIIFKLF